MSERLSLSEVKAIRTAVLKCADDDVISVAVGLLPDSQGRVDVWITRALKGDLQEDDK